MAMQQQVAQLAAACESLHAVGSGDADASQRRRAADAWITQFQQTKEAWNVCEGVLSASQSSTINVQQVQHNAAVTAAGVPLNESPRCGCCRCRRAPSSCPAVPRACLPKLALSRRSRPAVSDRRFTAAQTLNRKMRYDLPQLPASAHGALRDSLLSLLVQRTKGEAAFVSASAPVVTQLCLAVAALSLQMPDWTGVVASLVGMFESQGPGALPCLLQLLQVIPEECARPAIQGHTLRYRSYMEQLNSS